MKLLWCLTGICLLHILSQRAVSATNGTNTTMSTNPTTMPTNVTTNATTMPTNVTTNATTMSTNPTTMTTNVTTNATTMTSTTNSTANTTMSVTNTTAVTTTPMQMNTTNGTTPTNGTIPTIGATNQTTPTTSNNGMTTTPTTTLVVTTQSSTGNTDSGLIGVAVAMALIIITLVIVLVLVLIIGLWYMRRRSTMPCYLKMLGRSPNQQDDAQLRNKSRGTRKSVMFGSQVFELEGNGHAEQIPFCNETLRRRLQPISVDDLPGHVKKLHETMNQGFRIEFETLEMAPQATFQAAMLEGNRHKNRYRNIAPYDHSRVRLMVLHGKENSDYINADYIDGYRVPNKFIATQGPLLETLDDFWRMIWEVKSQNIIMLTNIKETDMLGNERTKCEKYWPDELDVEMNTGSMNVKLTKITQLSDYIVREIKIYQNKDGDSLTIKQFHFTVWPDHGVPQFATGLIAFIRAVNRNQLADTSGAHVVHCSAGVGRSGTYITLNSMLERINLENNVNVYEFVRLMRSKRNYMVQTQEQFVFIYDALVELVTSGDTSIPSDLAVATINSFKEVYQGQEMSTIANQFKILREYSRQPDKDSCDFGLLPENRKKNRYQDKVPFDDYRVRITPIGESTDYINASFVDGYKQKRAYIAAQSPSEETVGDFWRMVYEKESAVLVMLSGLTEGDTEICYKYWPDLGEEVSFQHYTIKNLEERREEGYLRRRLQIVFSFHNKYIGSTVTDERKVTQLCLDRWPDSNQSEHLTPFLAVMDAMERLQAANQNPPITVHCKDGVGQTGTFLTMYSVLEKLKPEHLVDVFQILKKARIQRPMLVETEHQYEMCYNFVICYLDSFDAYANFCVRSNESFRIESADSVTESTNEIAESNASKI